MMPLLKDWLKRGEKRPKQKKFMRKISARRAEQLAEYRKLLPGWIAAHPKCEIGPRFRAAGVMVKCKGKTTHPHHVRGRIGKLLCDTRYFLASCSGECHPQAVHYTHKKEAKALGMLSP